MAFGGNVTLDLKLLRPNKTYRKGDLVTGIISVHSSSDTKHDGIAVALEGTLAMQMDNKNLLLETFYSSLKPTQLAFSSLEMAKPGRLAAGTTEIPFELKLVQLVNKTLYETYHGVYITVQYTIKCEMKRSVLNRDIIKSLEFVVEVPQPYDDSENKPLTFNITPESLQNIAESTKLPRFCIKGQLDRSHFRITEPMLGELIVENCEIGIKSIELQLARVETCGSSEGFAKEATEIQNIQIGDGDVCRNLSIPIHMVFPRLFTCPTTIAPNFKIEFEVNLVIIFQDDHLVMETFEIKLIRP
ncbi:vacuolar protein sorting-associated protein 26C-like [Paramacrobiotus metropolitanus]|uniref:vacuolar protein sorting-associated protein 26C-like n=1 Tax=Paramacrobiotus metropolitanus TaxID=2943436 RepID=UPI002445C754|nr:vacuolar protein sorting-associated protein 26C-like [Paramacrobiotus metropolitanus]XP_055338769.1 vacuolar protein sorting-associated protein 26C-like [Paramacrobiotus metropolitanus]XP_055338771.1 vacuolar protein sorting-associated protein 26C-like [Paramacrobiotus metropolitanus]